MDRGKTPSIGEVHLDQPGGLVNTIFRKIFAAERSILPTTNLPFGVSLLAVARPKR
jgi:hypothetical protein